MRINYTEREDAKLMALVERGLSWKEIGIALGRSVDSVKGRVKYLKSAVRRRENRGESCAKSLTH